MKQITKRSLAFLMAVVLCLSLLPVLHFTADAVNAGEEYVTVGSYIKNWGTRGTRATDLSANAKKFYTEVTYDDLMANQGGTGTSDAYNSDLYDALQTLMTSNHTYITSYNDTRDLFQYTDCEANGTRISSFYSGTLIGPEWDSGGTWNREHTWPDSKGLEGSDEDDIMMLRPTATAGSENSSRGNTAYGESSSYYDPNDVSGGKYNLHGDVARIMLYVYVRWGNTGNMWGTSGVMESLDVLLRWIEEDPVDTWEMGRNDSVESITGTRNVFVDYPELAFALFGAEIPTDMDTPSGEAVNSGYTITAVSNNTEYGTVSLDGRNITATPAEGCRATGYTVLSGTATVTRNGNVFAVSANSDCTVQIDFAPADSASVSFVEDGVTVSAADETIDEPITLPAYSGEVTDGFTFLGWVTESMDRTESKPSTIYKAGDSYTVTGDVTFYALFSLVQGVGGTGKWNLVTDAADLYAGANVIIAAKAEDLAVSTTQNNNNRGEAVITKNSDNTITFAEDAGVAELTVCDGTVAGTFAFYDAANSGYLYAAGGGNYLRTKSTLDATGSCTVSISDSTATVKFQQTGQNWLRYNTQNNLFSCYSSGQTDICLYVQDGDSMIVYTVTTAACEHPNAKAVAAVAPTCTESGYTAGVYCDDCLNYISGHEKIDALGHSYSSVIVDKTIIYTCANCKDSYSENYYQVVFHVPEGITAPATVNGANGIELPSADAPEGWTFLGWTEEIVDNETEEPTYLKAGTTFTATNTDILYALYSKSSGSTQYVLTDLAAIQSTDTVVITMTYTDGTVYALYNGNGTGSAPTAVTVTVTGNALAAEPEDTLKWNVSGTSSGYTFYVAGTTEKWLYCTNTNNGVRVGTNTNKTFVLDSASGYLKHVGTSRYLGVYRTNPDWRCYTNTTGNTANQTLGFYVKPADAGSTTYTTVFEGSCAHEDLNRVPYQAPTCTEPGRQAGMTCNDCDAILTGCEEIPATGHSSSYTDNGDGTHDYVCATCQIVETDNEAHSFTDGTCVCGAVESTGGETESQYAAELTLKSINLDLGSAITMNFNGLASVFTQYEDVYVLYQAEGKADMIVRTYYESSSGDDLRHNFAYDGLTALDLGLEVYATVYGTKDGVLYHGDTKSYSLLKFCTTSIGKGDNDAVVCANLLLYGNAAQVYKNVAEGALVLNQLTQEQLALVEQYAYSDADVQVEKTSVVSQENAQVKFVSQSLDMLSRIALVFKISTADYTGQLDAVTFRITYTDAYGTEQVKNYTMEDLVVVDEAAGTYELYFSEFYSTQMRQLALCEIYVDGQLHASYQNSIENYCYTTLNNANESETLKALVRRICLYGDAAYNTYAS